MTSPFHSRVSRPRPFPALLALALLPAVATLQPLASTAAPRPEFGRVELLRDSWGVPHVFSTTDAGAFYGLGYATAEERGLQMTYSLRIIQGRAAEILGDRPRPGRRDTTVDSDRRMRTLGWSPAAARTAALLDPPTRTLLEAYCDGVNDSFTDQRAAGRLHPLFAQLGFAPEPWTPADCLLSWWHLAQFFASDGTRDLLAARNRDTPRPGQPRPPTPLPSWTDDATAVVQRSDVSPDWVHRVDAFARQLGLPATPAEPPASAPDGPRFSHAWVVGGKRSTTGAAILVSDPQTPVRNPSLWMEFHLSGATFDVRGIGVPGSPGLLLGFNRHVAWGLTALGADQADLFRLETSPDHPDAYRWKGAWRPMTVRTERLRVKDGRDVSLVVRETHLGPVASEFCFRQPGDPEVALKRVPLCEPGRDTIQGVVAMMRATNATTFLRALPDWRFPSANVVFGDARGQVGYATLGAFPIRSPEVPDPNGGQAGPGTRDAHDWRGFVPFPFVPQFLDPTAGLVFSANHRPVASFYPIPLGVGTGGHGDTLRSWRLRERLSRPGPFTPDDVLAVHHDTVNPARRDMVRLALHLRDRHPGALTPPSVRALEVLQPWLAAGASSDLRSPGADLATRISTFFRFLATPLALRYGGGESGLARFLKDATARIAADPQAEIDPEAQEFLDRVLAEAWRAHDDAGSRAGTAAGRGRPAAATTRRTLGWFDSLDGFGSLDPAGDLVSPGITCLDGQTILSQAGQSYTQWVPLHDVDAARTVCPIGHSDRPDSPYRTSTMTLWAEAELHPAPLSRAAVEKITRERRVLAP